MSPETAVSLLFFAAICSTCRATNTTAINDYDVYLEGYLMDGNYDLVKYIEQYADDASTESTSLAEGASKWAADVFKAIEPEGSFRRLKITEKRNVRNNVYVKARLSFDGTVLTDKDSSDCLTPKGLTNLIITAQKHEAQPFSLWNIYDVNYESETVQTTNTFFMKAKLVDANGEKIKYRQEFDDHENVEYKKLINGLTNWLVNVYPKAKRVSITKISKCEGCGNTNVFFEVALEAKAHKYNPGYYTKCMGFRELNEFEWNFVDVTDLPKTAYGLTKPKLV